MTREQQHNTEEELLDQQWDAHVTGRTLIAEDPTIRELHAAQGPAAPSPLFVSQLRSMIEVAAQDQIGAQPKALARTEQSTLPITQAQIPQPIMRPVHHHRPGRMRGLGRAGKVVSVLLAASLLVAIAGAMIRYPFGDSNGTGAPTNQPPGTSIAAVSSPVVSNASEMASSADPGRTNEQPGPGPTGIPEIVGQADVTGSAMALGGNTLVIVDSDAVTALDATSLDQKWSVDVPYGVYTEPVIAGDAIYFGFTGQRDGTTVWLLGSDQPNQLVSLSLKDGSENWRIDGAGAYPVAPIVVNGTVYAVGTTKDAYRLGAYEPADGSIIWTAEPFDSQKTDGRPKVIPYLWMRLAYDSGLIAVNQLNGLSVYDAGAGKVVWTHEVTKPDLVDAPLIADGTVVVTIGHQSADAQNPGSAKVIALDLRTGQERWAQKPVSGNMFNNFSATQRGTDLVTAQFSADNEWELVAINAQSGDRAWSVPSWDTAADPGPNFWQNRDSTVIAGDQVFTLGVASDRGNQVRTLVTAREIATGDIDWTAVIDGTAETAPIVAGGKIYVLTDLYGLQVLGDSPDASDSTPESNVADLRDPVTCIYGPTESPLLGTPATDRTPVPAFDRMFAPMAPDDVPTLDPQNAVSQDVANAIQQRLDAFTTCTILGDYTLLFNFFSTDYYLRIREMGADRFNGRNGESGETAVRLMNDGTKLEISELQVLPDGRIGGQTVGNTHAYIWFVLEDGVYKIDEMHGIADRPEPEESPSPEE